MGMFLDCSLNIMQSFHVVTLTGEEDAILTARTVRLAVFSRYLGSNGFIRALCCRI